MKKIVLAIILIIMPIFKAIASETYYSEYSEFSPFQEEKVNSSDIVNVITERRYLWYKQEYKIGDYKLYNDSDNFALDQCYETNYTEFQEKEITPSPSKTIDTRIRYDYVLSKAIRYINIYDVFGSYGAFRIPELIVEVDGKEINYQYTCIGCWKNFENYIHNGKYLENKSVIDNGGSLKIDLLNDYPIHKIKLTFYMFDIGSVEKVYNVSFASSNDLVYAKKEYRMNFKTESHEDTLKVSYKVEDLNTVNDYQSLFTTYEEFQSDYISSSKMTKEYRYKEKYCKTKDIINTYNDSYTKESIGEYIYKSDYYKDYYKYQTRDKIELDIKEITNKNYDLNSFVISSSKDYQILDNIDINKNGLYEVKYILNDLEVTKNVSVNLEENTIRELNQQLEDLTNKYNDLLDSSNKKINDLENSLKKCQDDCNLEKECLNKLIDEKNELIIKYEEEIKSLKEALNDLKNKTNEEINNINNNYKKIINQYKEEIESLEKQITKLTNDYNNLLKETNEKINNLEEDNKYLNEIILEKEEIIKNYQNKIIILSEEINNLQIKINKKIEIITSLNNKNDQYKEEISSLNKKMELFKEEASKLNEKIIKEYDEKINNLESINKAYKNKIKELENTIKSLNNNISEYTSVKENEIETLQKEIKSLTKELSENQITENDFNNYVLKINNKSKYTILIVIAVVLLFVIEKLKNKSNK